MNAKHKPYGDQYESEWRVGAITRLRCACGWQTMPGWHLPSLRAMLDEHIDRAQHDPAPLVKAAES